MRKSVPAGVTMVLLLAAGPSTGQTTDGTRPRTAWGEPDLQGIWTNATTNSPIELPEPAIPAPTIKSGSTGEPRWWRAGGRP